jgi:UDP-2-acetamido-3-amino-2,3-dideoxy-glucuronate N-acetyltransferase
MIDPSAYIHPTSVIDEGASLGAETKIWHFCHVFAGARIGARCVVGQGCSVAATVRVGDGVKIQNGVSLYDGVVLEDEVFCGPHMVFTNVVNPRAFVARREEYRPTRVARGASIGAGAVVVCGHTIGQYAFVGAGAVVTRDVPAFALVYGNPARLRGWVDRRGERLAFDADGRATGSDGATYRLEEDTVILEDGA